MTTTLAPTTFVLARLADDEAAALAAMALASTPWRATYGRQVETSRDGYLVTPEDEHSRSDEPPDDVATYIATHDPARVLAQVAALRAVVESLSNVEWATYAVRDVVTEQLAAIWQDHPDFNPAWLAS